MSTLIVLGYPSEAEAKSAYQKILDLDKNLIVSLQSVAVVARRADGKYDVVTPGSKVGTSAVWGLFWGVLFGLLFFVPIVGAALGAGIGALTGAIVKHGVDKDFQDRVRNLLSTDDRDDHRQVHRRHPTVRRRRAANLAVHQGRGRAQTRAFQELASVRPKASPRVGPEALPSCESEDGRAFGRMRDASRVFRAFPSLLASV